MNETLDYYNQHAEDFFADTSTADMHESADRFLRLLPEGSLILDFGCGSGRDSVYFLQRHYRVRALDGSEEMCRLAQTQINRYTRQETLAAGNTPAMWRSQSDRHAQQERPIGEVSQMQFADFHEQDTYDGIWACASILHLPKAQLPDMLCRLCDALHEGGILYTSFKYGSFEGARNGRHFTDLTEGDLRKIVKEVPGLRELEMWQTQDVRPERTGEKWINAIFRKSQDP